MRQWIHSRECANYEGLQGNTTLSPLEIKIAIKTYKSAHEKTQHYDELAQEVGLNILNDAVELVG